jgi:hypothetical protein
VSPPPASTDFAPDLPRACPAARRRDDAASSRGAAMVAAAVLAQGAALAWLGGAGAAAVLAGAVAAGLCAVAWERRGRVAHLDVLVATVAFGGWGMLLGEWAARALAPPAMHGMAHAHAAPAAGLAATGVMLLTCAAACRWSCAPLCRGGWMRRGAAHLLAAAGMVGGMAAAASLLAPHSPAGMHLAMVAGMAIGMAAALPFISLLDGRRALPRHP